MRLKKLILFGIIAFLASFSSQADTVEDVDYFEAGGNYYCYPWTETPPPALTPAPKGYMPFHIEHYGRHGSRWLIGDKSYDVPYELLTKAQKAGKLTPLGEEVLDVVVAVRDEFKKGRDGELSDKGALQHQDIGKRMVENFPEVFTPETNIDARSTVIIRSILSMFNGLSGIQTYVPEINIKTDASRADMYYLNFWDQKMQDIRSHADSLVLKPYQAKHANKGEYLKKLFNDEQYAQDSIGSTLFGPLFSLLINTQSHFAQPWIADKVFTIDEARESWLCKNAFWFVECGNSKITDNYQPFSQKNLLTNIIESADTAIISPRKSVNLRYGHDNVVMPLVTLMEINDYGREINDLEEVAEKGWHIYKVVPMAANLQIVFYQPENVEVPNPEDVLVKVMLNEEEVTLPVKPVEGPYYKWSELKDYYLKKLSGV